MKKALSLLLTFLIAASVFVINIGTVSAVTPIQFVYVKGIRPPVPGEHPDYSNIKLETEWNAAEIIEMRWADKYYNLLCDDYTFVEGEKYIIYFIIKPKSGYCFEFDGNSYTGDAEIKDFTVRSSRRGDSPNEEMLFLDCNWVVAEEYNPTAITSVNVTGLEAVAGGVCGFPNINVTTVPENAAEISSLGMLANCVSDKDTFVEGEEYKIFLTIEPKFGYYFEFDDDYNYNGEIKVKGITYVYGENNGGSLYIDCAPVIIEQHVPEELTDSQFLMYADEVYGMTDRGIMLTGRVLNGRINKGDYICVTDYDGTDYDGTKSVTEVMPVQAIYMYGKNLDYAEKGDYIGILIGMPYGKNEDGSINKGNIKIGTAVQNLKETIPPVTEMVGTFKMLSTEEGGRYTPIEEGFRPQAYVGTSDVTCTFLDLNGGAIQPGETRTNVKLGDFYHGVVVYKGQEILIQQSGRTVGTFTVGETTAYGDVNIDGAVNILDATEIQKYLAMLINFTEEQKLLADTNFDGKINILDVTEIQKYIAQIIDHLG